MLRVIRVLAEGLLLPLIIPIAVALCALTASAPTATSYLPVSWEEAFFFAGIIFPLVRMFLL